VTESQDWSLSRHADRAALLGYRMEHTDSGSVAYWTPTPFMSNSIGVVHGGLVGSVVDDVCAAALRVADPTILASPTVSLHIDYLRPLVLGADYTCRGEVLRIGGRLAVADVHVVDADGVLCLRGSGTFALTRRG
jgi:acyl-CoA thioesterase